MYMIWLCFYAFFN